MPSIGPDHHPDYPPSSGPNVESNIETPPATKPKWFLVTLTITTTYNNGASRDRTGDLWLAKRWKVNRQQPKPAILLGFRVSFDRQQPP